MSILCSEVLVNRAGNSLVFNGVWKVYRWLEIAILFFRAVLYVRVNIRHPVSNINSILLSSSLFGAESMCRMVNTFPDFASGSDPVWSKNSSDRNYRSSE